MWRSASHLLDSREGARSLEPRHLELGLPVSDALDGAREREDALECEPEREREHGGDRVAEELPEALEARGWSCHALDAALDDALAPEARRPVSARFSVPREERARLAAAPRLLGEDERGQRAQRGHDQTTRSLDLPLNFGIVT